MSESKEDDINNTMEPIVNSWDDCIPEELSPDEPHSCNLFRYDSDVELINLTQFTSLTRNFINCIFREEQSVELDDFSHIYEDISHDGFDTIGPCSNLFDLFITIYRPDGYYYFFYQAEQWYTPNEVVEYTLADSFTSNSYDPIIYNQTDWRRVRDELK